MLNQFTTTSDPEEQMAIMQQIEEIFVEGAYTAPLFGSPEWGEFSTLRFTGFPNPDDPYTTLASRAATAVMVMTTVHPVDSQ